MVYSFLTLSEAVSSVFLNLSALFLIAELSKFGPETMYKALHKVTWKVAPILNWHIANDTAVWRVFLPTNAAFGHYLQTK